MELLCKVEPPRCASWISTTTLWAVTSTTVKCEGRASRRTGTAAPLQLPASNRVRPVQTASAYLGLSRRGTRKRNSRHQDPGAELSSTFRVVTSLGRVDSRQEVFANGLAAEASGLPSRFHQPSLHRLFIAVAAADIRGGKHGRLILFLRF